MMRVGLWEGLSGHAPLLVIYLLVTKNRVMRTRIVRYNYTYPSSKLLTMLTLCLTLLFLLFLLSSYPFSSVPPSFSPPHLQLQQDKTKGVEGLIDIENPNRVVKKTKKAGDIDINARVELSRKERLVTLRSLVCKIGPLDTLASFPDTCHSYRHL